VLRKGKIIYITHCVLNQNAVIRDWERAQGAFNNILRVLLDQNISIVQLPCPELTFLGKNRQSRTKEEYDTFEYRNICRQLAKGIVNQMKEYTNNNYQIIGLLGIEESPSCDSLGEKGIFIEELFTLMGNENIYLDSFDIPKEYMEGGGEKTIKDFYYFCMDKLSKY